MLAGATQFNHSPLGRVHCVARTDYTMSRDDDQDAFALTVFLGERAPIHRLANSLTGAVVLELGSGICAIPVTSSVCQAIGVNSHSPGDTPQWPFRTIDARSAERCAALAGGGRLAYLETWGYRDEGQELGVAWLDGVICVGLVDVPWYSGRGGSIDQIGLFLGAPLQDVFRRRLLQVATHSEQFIAAARQGNHPFRGTTP